MSTDFKKRFLIFMLPVFAITVVLMIAVHFSGAYVQDTKLVNNNESQSYSMTMSSEISSIESTKITPEIEHRVDFDNFTLKISFNEPLEYGTSYTIDINMTDVRQKQSNVSSTFDTSSPDIYFISRNTDGLDTLYRTTTNNLDKQVVYQSENLMLYALGKKSVFVVDYENKFQSAKIIIDEKETTVQVPSGYLIDSIDGSYTSDDYIATLENKDTYEKTLWRYANKDRSFSIILGTDSKPIIGYDAQYASDGKSIFYSDQNMSVILLSENSSSPPINLGTFSELSRILPLNKGVFGFKQIEYLTVLSSDGSEQIAPDIVQTSSLTQQLTNLTDYTYIKRELDDSRLNLIQLLIYYSNSKESIINKVNSKERLILKSYLSPNDQFLVTEESNLPVIIDKLPKNGNAENVEFIITDIKTTKTLVKEKGFDVKWKL